MTSLRGLDGLQAKEIEMQTSSKQKSGQGIRDVGIMEHFTKMVSRGLLDINEREIEKGEPSIFDFTFSTVNSGPRINGIIVPNPVNMIELHHVPNIRSGIPSRNESKIITETPSIATERD